MGLAEETLGFVTHMAIAAAKNLVENGMSEDEVKDVFKSFEKRTKEVKQKAAEYDREIADALDAKFGKE